MQILPLFALLVGRRIGATRRRLPTVLVVAASYALLLGLLLAQALGGESVVAPGPATLAALAVWLTATVAGLALVLATGRNGSGAPSVSAAAS